MGHPAQMGHPVGYFWKSVSGETASIEEISTRAFFKRHTHLSQDCCGWGVPRHPTHPFAEKRERMGHPQLRL